MAANNTLRYSDQELAIFQQVIDAKLSKAKAQLLLMQSQIIEATQNASDEHGADWMDDSSMNAELDMLNNMAIRQRKYLKELENALIRIKNKAYGICIITGNLIDKRRLMAVPTTTKSVAAKNAISSGKMPKTLRQATRKPSRKIISKKRKGKAPRQLLSFPNSVLEDDLLSEVAPPLPLAEEIPVDQRPKLEDMD